MKMQINVTVLYIIIKALFRVSLKPYFYQLFISKLVLELVPKFLNEFSEQQNKK